jgi:hypothetical protein
MCAESRSGNKNFMTYAYSCGSKSKKLQTEKTGLIYKP